MQIGGRFAGSRFADGGRFGGLAAPVAALGPVVASLPDGTAQIIDNGNGTGTFVVTGSSVAAYNGSTEITFADLNDGPVIHVAHDVAGTPAVGQVISLVRPAFWIVETDHDLPEIEYRIYRDGVQISGATLPYTIVAQDQDAEISVGEHASQFGGRESEVLAATTFAVPASTHVFEDAMAYANGTLLRNTANWTSVFDDGRTPIAVEGGVAGIDATSIGGVEYLLANPTLTADHYVEFEVTDPGTMPVDVSSIMMAMVRMTDEENWYGVQARQLSWGSQVRFARRVGGALATVWTGPAFSAGDILRIEAEGTEVRILQNGLLLNTFAGETDLSGGGAGFNIQHAWGVPDFMKSGYIAGGNIT